MTAHKPAAQILRDAAAGRPPPRWDRAWKRAG